MAQISVIRKSQLEGAMRLDAEYYQPKYLEIARVLKQQPKVANVGSLCKLIYRYPSFYNLVYQDHGVLVLKGEDIDAQGVIDNVKADHISRETSESFPKTILKKHDLIISVRGYVGKVGLVDSEYIGAIISPNLIRLEVDSSKISPAYLWVFLNSRYGSLQITRAKMQTSQETIVSSDIKNMLVPLPNLSFQTEIENIVEIATKQGSLSKSFYLKAEQLLLDELGFKDLDLGHQFYYTVPFKKTKEANRLDAEHFQPKYERLKERLLGHKGGAKVLGSLIQPITNGYDYREFVSDGIPYLRVGDVRAGWLDLFSAERISAHFIKKDIALSVGDVLFTRKGTYGVASQVRLGEEGCVISSEIMRLRLLPGSQVLSDYLALFLNSVAARMQVEKYVHGFSNFSITQADIQKLIVPLPARSFQERVAELVTQSWEARQKARQLLEEAKSKVENLIEDKA